MIYESKIGNTVYTLEQEPNSFVKLTRKNSDGVATFYVPLKLVIKFAVAKIALVVSDKIGEELNDIFSSDR